MRRRDFLIISAMLASGPQRAYAQQIGPKKRVALVHPSSKVAGMKIVDRTMASRFTSVSLNASVTSKEKISSSNVIQRKVSRSDGELAREGSVLVLI